MDERQPEPTQRSLERPGDRFGRPLGSLRISVTDRCNLRCSYCMPEEEYVWLPKPEILRFEEIGSLVDAFLDCGVTRVRLTGGEPLLRRDIEGLVGLLAAKPGLEDLALTTNAILLPKLATPLREVGLDRITVSLDTLRPDRFRELTRRDELDATLRGIEAATEAGFRRTKINMVVMRGQNDDEIEAMLDFARAGGLELRFIEYMDVGGATQWSTDAVVGRAELLATIERAFGSVTPLEPGPEAGAAVTGDSVAARAPAQRFELPDGTRFGIIASTTAPFCATCDRARLTADGKWFRCLYARVGTDLAAPLRAGAARAELADRIRGLWRERTDRGAEERLAAAGRTALAEPSELRSDPHLEMHTRGG